MTRAETDSLRSLPLFESMTGECVPIDVGHAFTLSIAVSGRAMAAPGVPVSSDAVATAMADAGFTADLFRPGSSVLTGPDRFLKPAPSCAQLFQELGVHQLSETDVLCKYVIPTFDTMKAPQQLSLLTSLKVCPLVCSPARLRAFCGCAYACTGTPFVTHALPPLSACGLRVSFGHRTTGPDTARKATW